uniref:Calmodulin n=1 Tax=Macrostomum lignano TaxID=282301 RepID=A0A1I8F373_9PLAT
MAEINAPTRRSGSIDFSEFVALMETRKTEDELRSEIQETFKVFDRDQDGPLELRHVLSNLGIKLSEREAADMIAEADFNKDGLVDFEEFYRMMTARNAASKQRKVFHNCSKAFKKFRTIMESRDASSLLLKLKPLLRPGGRLRWRLPSATFVGGVGASGGCPQILLDNLGADLGGRTSAAAGRTSPCPAAASPRVWPPRRRRRAGRRTFPDRRWTDSGTETSCGSAAAAPWRPAAAAATSCDCGGCPKRPTDDWLSRWLRRRLSATAQRPWTPAVWRRLQKPVFSSPLSTEEVLATKQIWPHAAGGSPWGHQRQRDALIFLDADGSRLAAPPHRRAAGGSAGAEAAVGSPSGPPVSSGPSPVGRSGSRLTSLAWRMQLLPPVLSRMTESPLTSVTVQG